MILARRLIFVDCPNCGARTEGNAKSCPTCGHAFGLDASSGD